MRGSVIKRCPSCRKESKSEYGKCAHKEACYHIRYRFEGKQCSEFAGFSKKDAEKKLFEVISQIYKGTFKKPSSASFKEYAEIWLTDYALGTVKDSTFRNYKNVIHKRLNLTFGNMKISDLTTHKIQSFMAGQLKGRNPHTVNKCLVLLKTMLKHARRWGYLRENPAQDIDRFRAVNKEMDFLNPTEIRHLLQYAIEPFKTILLVAILTGLRRGELLALQWGDIDFNSGLINVRRSVFSLNQVEAIENEAKCWKFVTPKSPKSIRRVVMTPQLKEALEVHRLNSPSNPYDLIFANRKGEPLDGQNMIHREFYPTLEAAGMRKIRFHDLRHSYTSLLIAQNENVKFIQSQLGHASITTTIDRYGHLMPISSKEVGNRLDCQIFDEAILSERGNAGGTELVKKKEMALSFPPSKFVVNYVG